MLYYQHDSDAFFDEKITDLFAEFGYEGLGYFYTLLEKLSQAEKPIRMDILKMMLIPSKRNTKIFDFLLKNKIISIKDDKVFNERLLNDIKVIQKSRTDTKHRVRKHRIDNEQLIPNVTGYNNVTANVTETVTEGVTPTASNGHVLLDNRTEQNRTEKEEEKETLSVASPPEKFVITTFLPLPENIQESAEINQFTYTQNKNTKFVKDQWKLFLSERMAEDESKKSNYRTIGDLTSYFLNWIRTKFPPKGKMLEHQNGNNVKDIHEITKNKVR